MPKRKRQKLSKEQRDKRKQQILSKAAQGLTCAQICQQMGLKAHIVQYAMKNNTALALVSKANQALEKSHESPMTSALTRLIDILNVPTPEFGVIEEAVIRPKERKVKLTLRRELELTV